MLCNNIKIADEFHYILECKALIDIRKDYLGKYYTKRPNEIMSTLKEKMLKKTLYVYFEN